MNKIISELIKENKISKCEKICYECNTEMYIDEKEFVYCPNCSYKNIDHGNLFSGF